MLWRPAVPDDAPLLATLATATSGVPVTSTDARTFLHSWSVQLALASTTEHPNPSVMDRQVLDRAGVVAAVAVLAPTVGHQRGHGAWWSLRGADSEVISRLVGLASGTPGLRVLQVGPETSTEVDELRAHGFNEAYPLWTMTHDNTTWPDPLPALPADLRTAPWADVSEAALHTTYEHAYRDQRLVEPHTPETLHELVSDSSFAPDLSTVAVSPDGQVVGFVLACLNARGEVELGPIGTDPTWRGRGVSSALLASTLTRCRDTQHAPITLTVDAESPTGAQHLYLRHGFQITRRLHAYHLHLPPPTGPRRRDSYG